MSKEMGICLNYFFSEQKNNKQVGTKKGTGRGGSLKAGYKNAYQNPDLVKQNEYQKKYGYGQTTGVQMNYINSKPNNKIRRNGSNEESSFKGNISGNNNFGQTNHNINSVYKEMQSFAHENKNSLAYKNNIGCSNSSGYIFDNEYNNNSGYKKNTDYFSGKKYDYYQLNYIYKYDYSEEKDSENFKKNKIYCGVKGLPNHGNNCFLNSTIQCLKHCFDFTKYIINEVVTSNGAFGEFKKLIENMCNNNSSFQPNVLGLKKAMIVYNPIYKDSEQHDSTIFFNDLLNALNSELSEGSDYDEDEDDDDDESFQVKYENCINKSKVNEYFSFFIKEITEFNCGEKMIDYQEYYYLDLPIFDENNREIKDIYTAMDKYTNKSYDTGKNTFICSKHQKREKSFSQNLFASLPEIFVISLKRVVNGQHIDHYLHYEEILEMGKYIQGSGKSTTYELFAEVLHYGSAYGGHKIAICKNFNTGIWYRFNDSSVTIEKSIISSNAFLLFYKRV